MKPGRPKPILDYVIIEKLASLGCTDYEIAYAIGYTPRHFNRLKRDDTLIREAIDRGSNAIKVSIRRAQLRLAVPKDYDEPGNCTMLIWLGKQYLHQSDHLKLSGDEDAPLRYVLKWADEIEKKDGEGEANISSEAAHAAKSDSA